MTGTEESKYTKVTAQCHCKRLTASLKVPTEALPLPIWLCSCDTCRKSSGLLCITSVHLPEDWKDIEVSGESVRYRTSSGPAGIVRCFCGTCGAFVYEESEDKKRWGLSGGALTQFEGIGKTGSLIYTGDTRDGGIAEWLPQFESHDLAGEDRGKYDSVPSAAAVSSDGRLHASCHCGGVEFFLTRPGPESQLAYPKVNDCFEPGYKPSEAHPPESVRWYLCADDTKYAGELCFCNSCRLCSGFDINPWVFVPIVNVVQKDGSALNLNMGTLKMYRSSPEVERYFCGKCGAKVFFKSDNQLIDIAVGLMDSESGARAEDWIVWTHLMSFHQDAQNRELFNAVLAGLEAWRQRTGKSGADGPKPYL